MSTVRVGIVGAKFAAMLHTESYRRLEHVQIVLGAYRSAQTGRPVDPRKLLAATE